MKQNVLVVDNFDSFTYNLVQFLGELGAEITVLRNDRPLQEFIGLNPDKIVISPGPGHPRDAGVTCDIIRHFGATTPILGVCLGHQAIGHVFGAIVRRNSRLMHGKTSLIHYLGNSIFSKMPNPFQAGRYHSLVVDADTCEAAGLQVIARTQEGEVMAIQGRTNPKLIGIQFHPESILTPHGSQLFINFLNL